MFFFFYSESWQSRERSLGDLMIEQNETANYVQEGCLVCHKYFCSHLSPQTFLFKKRRIQGRCCCSLWTLLRAFALVLASVWFYLDRQIAG